MELGSTNVTTLFVLVHAMICKSLVGIWISIWICRQLRNKSFVVAGALQARGSYGPVAEYILEVWYPGITLSYVQLK